MDFEGAYRRLAARVITTMPEDQRMKWGAEQSMLNEPGLQSLCDYVNSMKGNAPTKLDGDAIAQHELLMSYTRAGFTREEAMTLLLAALENAAKMHVAMEMLKRHDDC